MRHYRLPSPKLLFKVSFWRYVFEKCILTLILIRPGSSGFKRIGGMQSVKKYKRIRHLTSTHSNPQSTATQKKREKVSQLGFWVPQTLRK